MKKLFQGLMGVFAFVGMLAVGSAVYFGWGPFERPMPISKVLTDASDLNGKAVMLRAKVGTGGDLLGRGAYQLDDGTAQIWVLTQNGAPREGSTVTLDAKVTKLAQLPGGLERFIAIGGTQLVALEEIRRR